MIDEKALYAGIFLKYKVVIGSLIETLGVEVANEILPAVRKLQETLNNENVKVLRQIGNESYE